VNQVVTVREHARLTTDSVESTLDRAQVSTSAFDWLCELSSSFSKGGAALVHVEGRRWLKVDNYVGVIETPCGTRLEILPKNFEHDDCIVRSRNLLARMISRSLDLPVREVGTADLQLFNVPLTEWVMRQFLNALDHLIKRGMRFDYQRVEEEQRFLRGQLNVAGQMRQPPGKQHLFQIRHDVFTANRPENRLLKLALEWVCKTTQEPSSWRLAHELRTLMIDVPASESISQDFRLWRHDRLMAHYQPAKPWCELILSQQMPTAVTGNWHGISLLFPMEKLFEKYVTRSLRDSLLPGARMTEQAASKYLCAHDGSSIFQLKPDIVMHCAERLWVLDTKWKRLDESDRANKYGLSQSDFYQMHAYGQKYLNGQGDLVLIYPHSASFTNPLRPFEFSGSLKLWVLPYDLVHESLVGFDQARLPLTSPKEQVSNKLLSIQ